MERPSKPLLLSQHSTPGVSIYIYQYIVERSTQQTQQTHIIHSAPSVTWFVARLYSESGLAIQSVDSFDAYKSEASTSAPRFDFSNKNVQSTCISCIRVPNYTNYQLFYCPLNRIQRIFCGIPFFIYKCIFICESQWRLILIDLFLRVRDDDVNWLNRPLLSLSAYPCLYKLTVLQIQSKDSNNFCAPLSSSNKNIIIIKNKNLHTG